MSGSETVPVSMNFVPQNVRKSATGNTVTKKNSELVKDLYRSRSSLGSIRQKTKTEKLLRQSQAVRIAKSVTRMKATNTIRRQIAQQKLCCNHYMTKHL